MLPHALRRPTHDRARLRSSLLGARFGRPTPTATANTLHFTLVTDYGVLDRLLVRLLPLGPSLLPPLGTPCPPPPTGGGASPPDPFLATGLRLKLAARLTGLLLLPGLNDRNRLRLRLRPRPAGAPGPLRTGEGDRSPRRDGGGEGDGERSR